jgi:hypothetical protein
MQSVGLKEWALVCAAMGERKQSVILRKGGIAEGREGFAFRHDEFFLFPTYFHEQVAKTRLTNPVLPTAPVDTIEIQFFAKLDLATSITSLEMAEALEPMHILRSEVVRERFEYDNAPGLQVAFVRVFRLNEPWRFPNAKAYGGCRSWVELPEPRGFSLAPVLSDAEHAARRDQFLSITRAGALT